MFEDILLEEEKCCGGCDPDCGCDCSRGPVISSDGQVDMFPIKDGCAKFHVTQDAEVWCSPFPSRIEETEANRAFLLRWKRDIEDGIEPPLEYSEILSVMKTFGEDLVDEVGLAYAGWEAEDEPGLAPDFDRERSLSIRAARSTMSTVFRDDPELKRAYSDNIAMTIYDQLWWGMKIEVPKHVRDKAAEAILNLIFD